MTYAGRCPLEREQEVGQWEVSESTEDLIGWRVAGQSLCSWALGPWRDVSVGRARQGHHRPVLGPAQLWLC